MGVEDFSNDRLYRTCFARTVKKLKEYTYTGRKTVTNYVENKDRLDKFIDNRIIHGK